MYALFTEWTLSLPSNNSKYMYMYVHATFIEYTLAHIHIKIPYTEVIERAYTAASTSRWKYA